jgi:hypothetical protein
MNTLNCQLTLFKINENDCKSDERSRMINEVFPIIFRLIKIFKCSQTVPKNIESILLKILFYIETN